MLTNVRFSKSILGFSKMDKNKCPFLKIPLYFWSKKSIICKGGNFYGPQSHKYSKKGILIAYIILESYPTI
jgi:hypothetical protein